MPLVSQIYTSRWLSAADLNPPGHPPGARRTAVIVGISQEPVGQDSRLALVADLASRTGQRWPKRWIINRTCSGVLVLAFGDEANNWVGKSVQIWAEPRMVRGQITPTIMSAALYDTSSAESQPPGNAAMPPPDPPETIQMGPGVSAPIPQGGPTPAQKDKVWAGPGSDLDDEIPL
jgi:hypothetical protein